MIKHIIFDFDGTMVDSRYLAVDLLNETATKYGYRKIKHSEYETLRTLSIIERCRALRIPVYLVPMILFDLSQRYRNSAGQLELVGGINQVIKIINGLGYKLSILSSNTKENISIFLKANGISEFDSIYSTNNSLKKDKSIRDFMLAHGLKPSEVIYVGDEVRDIVACQKNNVEIIAVTWGYDSKELLLKAGPDYIIEKPMDIIGVIKSIAI